MNIDSGSSFPAPGQSGKLDGPAPLCPGGPKPGGSTRRLVSLAAFVLVISLAASSQVMASPQEAAESQAAAAKLVDGPQPLRNTGRALLLADSSAGRIAILDENGAIVWEYPIGPLHDLHWLDNGHVLMQTSWTRVVELDPADNRIVMEYDSAGGTNQGKPVEVHAFQRLPNGNTMIAESGPARIIEVAPDGAIAAIVQLTVDHPHPHRDTRLARKLPDGNYLVCHEGDGKVREYAPDSTVVWEYEVPLFGREPADGHGPESFGNFCFSAVRLENGNTLIGAGNGHSLLEVTRDKEIVWKLEQPDLPGIQLAWITSLQVLPGGNIVFGNCHAGEANPQIVEVTRDKRVVWTFQDFNRFGNSLTNSQVTAVEGRPVAARPGTDR